MMQFRQVEDEAVCFIDRFSIAPRGCVRALSAIKYFMKPTVK